jgi:hypothetical protein
MFRLQLTLTAMVSDKVKYFFLIFGRGSVLIIPLLKSPFFVFERCHDTNLVSYCRKQFEYNY